jgi:hypothetical protein
MVQSVSPRDLRFVGVSLDCADPAELAYFYLQCWVDAYCGPARLAPRCKHLGCC